MIHSKTFILIISYIFIVSGCNFDAPDLRSKIDPASGKTYHVSDAAWDKLQIPEPGVDPQNKVPVIIYPEENILEIAIGPVNIPANSTHMLMPVHITALPFDVWLHGFNWAITDEDRNQLSSSFLHHFNMIDPNKRELFYPVSRKIFAAGRETPAVSVPSIIGMPLKADQPLLMSTMFQNVSDKNYTNIYLRIWFEYSDKDRLINPISVYPFTLDAAGFIPPKDFKVPPGESSASTKAQPKIDARIVGIGGHLHDYGEYVKVVDITSDNVVWTGEAITEDQGHVVSMPTDFFLLPWKKNIYKDHTYQTVAKYENPLSKPSPERGMGTIGGLFIPKSDENWDEPDYSNQEYQDDLVMVLGSPIFHQWHNISPDEMRNKIAELENTHQDVYEAKLVASDIQASGQSDEEHAHSHDNTQSIQSQQDTSGEHQHDHSEDQADQDQHTHTEASGQDDHQPEEGQEHEKKYETYEKGIGVAAEFDAFPNLHPMIVHFPVVLLMLAAVSQLFAL